MSSCGRDQYARVLKSCARMLLLLLSSAAILSAGPAR